MAWTPKFTFSATWDNITGKPSTFPSTWATVSDKPATATRWPTWNEVSGKPSFGSAAMSNASDFASSSDFNRIGPVSGGTYYDYLPSNRGLSYFFHAAGNSPTDAPASPARQTAVLGMDTSWGTVQLAITNDDSPQVFVRGNGATPWNRVWTAGDFNPSTKADDNAVVKTSGNQSNLYGNKTWEGSHTFNNGITTLVSYSNSFRALSGPGDLCGSGVGAGIRLMPNGFSTSNMTDIDGSGNMTVRGAISTSGSITASTVTVNTGGGTVGLLLDSNTGIIGGLSGIGGSTVSLHGEGNLIHISPNGRNATPRSSFYPDGSVTLGGHTTVSGNLSVSGEISARLAGRTSNASQTLTANDLNCVVEKTNNSNYTYTIPSGLGQVRDAITIVNSGTGGTVVIARASGVSLYRNGTNANISVGPGSMVTIYRSATANRWIA